MEDDLVTALLRELALDVAANDPEGVGFLYCEAFTRWADHSASTAPFLRERLLATVELAWGEGLRLPHVCPCGETRQRFFGRHKKNGRLRKHCTFCLTEYRAKIRGRTKQ